MPSLSRTDTYNPGLLHKTCHHCNYGRNTCFSQIKLSWSLNRLTCYTGIGPFELGYQILMCFGVWAFVDFILWLCTHLCFCLWSSEISAPIKVAAMSLILEIRLHTHLVGTNTRSGTEAIFTLVRPLARGVSGCLLDILLLILDTLISIFLCIMQWDEKELDTQFTPNVYFWTPNSEILAKALTLVWLVHEN